MPKNPLKIITLTVTDDLRLVKNIKAARFCSLFKKSRSFKIIILAQITYLLQMAVLVQV